jgi:hypothetical protein
MVRIAGVVLMIGMGWMSAWRRARPAHQSTHRDSRRPGRLPAYTTTQWPRRRTEPAPRRGGHGPPHPVEVWAGDERRALVG